MRARAPGRGAWIGVDPRRARRSQRQGQAQGRAPARVQDQCGGQSPPTWASGPSRRSARRRSTGSAWKRAPATSSTAPTASRPRLAPGKVHLLIHAADAGEDGTAALDQAWRVGGGEPQGMIFPEGRTILSMALGRENVVHVALTDPAAASRVRHALARWRAFTGPDRGPEGGEPALGPARLTKI